MLTQRIERTWLGNFSFLSVVVLLLICFQARADSSIYGRKLVAQYSVPEQQVAKFQTFINPAANLKELDQVTAMEAESEEWIGPNLQVDRESSPYTVVVTLRGKARFDGNVSTLWQSGWVVDGGVRSTVFPGLSKNNVKAGEELVLVKAAPATRFKEQQTVALALALVKAENFDFQGMDIEIWSGIADNSWHEVLLSFRWFALGLIVFVLRYFWVRRS